MNLGSSLVETLVPMRAGVVCITCDERGEDFEPVRDTRWSYARFEKAGAAESFDLMPSLSIPALPNPTLAARLREDAKGQREVARNQKGERSRAEYEKNAVRYAWRAEHVLQFSREMPSLVVALDQRRVVAAFRNGSRDARFRVVDVETRTVEHEANGTELAQLFGGIAQYQRPREEREALDQLRSELGDLAAQLPPNRGTLPSRAKLVAAGEGMILFTLVAKDVRGFVVVRYSSGRFESARELGLDHHGWRVGAIHDGHIVVCGTSVPNRELRVAIVDLDSDRMRATSVSRDEQPVQAIAASAAPVVWMPQHAGFALRVDLKAGVVDRVKVRKGLARYALMRIAVSPDGDSLLIGGHFESKRPLLLTDLKGSQERYVLPDEESLCVAGQPGRYPLLRRQPGFAFVDGVPEALSRGERTPLSALQRHVDPAPPDVRPSAKRLPAELQRRIEAVPLVSRMAEVDDAYSPGVVFRARRLSQEPERRGESKLGGLPDLGHGADWPRFKGTPMVFLAQFNLADVHVAAPGNRLPKSGLLSFFRAIDEEYGGPRWYDPESEAGAAMVLFAPDVDDLEPAPIPAHRVSREKGFASPPCAIELSRAMPLPPIDSLRMSQYQMSDDEWEAYLSLSSSLVPEEEDNHGRHQLLGYRDHGGREHEVSAERMANGLDQFGEMDLKSDAANQLFREASSWIPLVELSSCQVADWAWGDGGGALLWLVRDSDLDQARFDRAIAVSVR